MNPRRRRYQRMRRALHRKSERVRSRDANVYRDVAKRDVAPFQGTYAEWRKLPLTAKLGTLYHPAIIQQMNRRSVLLLPRAVAEGGAP